MNPLEIIHPVELLRDRHGVYGVGISDCYSIEYRIDFDEPWDEDTEAKDDDLAAAQLWIERTAPHDLSDHPPAAETQVPAGPAPTPSSEAISPLLMAAALGDDVQPVGIDDGGRVCRNGC